IPHRRRAAARSRGLPSKPEPADRAEPARGARRGPTHGRGGDPARPPGCRLGHRGQPGRADARSGRRRRNCRLWKLDKADTPGRTLTADEVAVLGVPSSPDVSRLAAAGERAEPITGQHSAVLGLAFSPDGHTIAAGDERGRITLWDTRAPGKP